ncbi:hypothetical protein EON68_03870 [archaeon]|nr:MAG: hypothetical protein EON68_03870 [archaeon]
MPTSTYMLALLEAVLVSYFSIMGYVGLLAVVTLRGAIFTLVSCIGSGVLVLLATLWSGGVPALFMGTAAGLLPFSLLLFWNAAMITSAEARAFQRGTLQIGHLLRRTPAVVA